MIPPLADKQHISVMVDLSGIHEGSNSNAMLRFELLPTIVSPPGLRLNFTRFLKVMNDWEDCITFQKDLL